jgi:uncharacterized protein (TIGR03437 family)
MQLKGSMHQIWIRVPLTIVLAAAAGAQQPAILPHNVVNAASYMMPALPGSSIAQGSVFTIFGSGIGPTSAAQASSFPLGTTLSGVTIAVTQGPTTVNALPLYVQANQINALMPSNAPTGWVSLRITYNNAPSNPSPVYVVHDSAGMYTFTGTGMGPAAIQNIASDGSLTINSNQATAKPGQTVQVYLTGLGPITTPDNQPPPAGNLPTQVEVWVGGVPASVVYSGRSPCCSGLDQIDFVVPPTAPTGCWVPVQVRTSGTTVSNTASMAIDANGAPCTDPSNPVSSTLIKGGATGVLSLIRTTIHQDVGVNAPVDVTGDSLSFTASQRPPGPFQFVPFLSAPPPGTCATYRGTGDYWSTGQIADSSGSTPLNSSTQFQVSGSGGVQSASLTSGGLLGSYIPLYSLPNQLFLAPGNYVVTASGTGAVGAINTQLAVPGPITWTNRDQTTNVDRTQPLTINWSGVPSGASIQILGENSDLPTNSSALFYCNVPAGATSFTVPPQVLSAIPATRSYLLDSTGVIFVVSSSPSTFSATGLNAGFASVVYKTGKTVIFQ